MSVLQELVASPELQVALVAALLVAVLASALGLPLVLRDMAMFGHGFGHVAFGGVALGFLLGIYPLLSALAFTVVAALLLLAVRRRGHLRGDTALGIVVSMGFAVGVVVVGLAGGVTHEVEEYLFGDILAVAPGDVLLMAAAALALLVVFALLRKEILYLTFSEEAARVQGLPVDALDALLTALTAATIVLASRLVGLLLVAALLVVPAATALQVARSFRGALLVASLAGAASAAVGLLGAVALGLETGGTIVLVTGAVFTLVAGWRRVAGRAGVTA